MIKPENVSDFDFFKAIENQFLNEIAIQDEKVTSSFNEISPFMSEVTPGISPSDYIQRFIINY